MDGQDFPRIGVGIGLRPPLYNHVLEHHPTIDWFEVITENFMVEGGRPLEVLERVRRDHPVVLHGVSLSLGSADPVNLEYLQRLVRLANRFEPAWISDHLCWTGIDGRNLHDLLPLPYMEETVAHLAARIGAVQEVLQRPIAIENISSYFTYTGSTMTEAEFLTAVAETAGCGILLDINNVFVNAFNHGFDPRQFLDDIPVERVIQFHLAGHRDCGAYLLDTHDQPICAEVWTLYEYAVRRFGAVPTLIERDDNIPAFADLQAEADEARRRSRQVIAQASPASAFGD